MNWQYLQHKRNLYEKLMKKSLFTNEYLFVSLRLVSVKLTAVIFCSFSSNAVKSAMAIVYGISLSFNIPAT